MRKYLFVILLIVIISFIGLSVYNNNIFTDENIYYEADINPEFNEEEIDRTFDEKYNLIVFGSEPEGISAAVAGARNGQKTLLIDERSRPGGLMTKGKLNTIDMNYNPDGKILNQGIFKEFYQELEGTSFNTETAEEVFLELIAGEDNLTYINSAEYLEPLKESDELIGLATKESEGKRAYYGQNFIDASTDADLARDVGVDYLVGMEDIGRPDEYQVATQVFELADVDWDEAKNHLNSDGNPNTGGDKRSLWGFSSEMSEYQPDDQRIDVRGLNVGRQEGDRVLINSIHLLDVDPLDKDSIESAKKLAEKELPSIVEHIKEEIPGFEDASLNQIAEELYIRESVHIKGLYTLTINDVRENRDFDDKIAFGSYPVDIQRTSIDNQGFVYNNPKKYSIPFRSLVPESIDNLLVVGRSASFDSLAHGSARVIPTGMATAEAAGIASRISIEEETGFHELAESEKLITELHKRLGAQGNYLDDFDYGFAGEDSKALDGIRFINSLGLLIGGYENQFNFDEKIETALFLRRLSHASARYFEKNNQDNKLETDLSYLESGELIDVDRLNRIYVEIFLNDTENLTGDEIFNSDFIDDWVLKYIEEEDYLSREVAYQIIKEFILEIEAKALS